MKKSFTLIELLVVIAIIAILAAILLPALKLPVLTARAAGCASNMKQLGLGMTQYIDTYNGWIPTHAGANTGKWFDKIKVFTKNEEIFLCPGSPRELKEAPGLQQRITIGINAGAQGKSFWGLNSAATKPLERNIKNLKQASTMVYLMDCVPYNNSKHPHSNNNPGAIQWQDNAVSKRIHRGPGCQASVHSAPASSWHNSVNFMYMDIHVETKKVGDILYLMDTDKWGDKRPIGKF